MEKSSLLHLSHHVFFFQSFNNAVKIQFNRYTINGCQKLYFFSGLLAYAIQRGILFMEDYSTGNDGERIAIVYSWSPQGDCRVASALFVRAK